MTLLAGRMTCGCAQRRDNRGGDGLPAIGAPGGLSRSLDHHRQIGVRRRPKTQGNGEKPRVVRHGLRAARISGERRGRNFQLLCQPLNERFDGLLQLRQGNAGMAQQSKLNGKADPIGIPAPCRHEVLIGAGQGEAPRHAVGIKWDAEESLPLLVGQQLSVRHLCPPIEGGDPTGRLSGKRTLSGHAAKCPETLDIRWVAGHDDCRTGKRTDCRGKCRLRARQHDRPGSGAAARRPRGGRCVKVFEDRASGARTDRAGLHSALDYVRDGDVLIVWKLDRLGRSLPHLIETVTSLATRGVGFRSITEAIDTTTPGGRLVFHLFGALGQFERDLIQERTRAGSGGLGAGSKRRT